MIGNSPRVIHHPPFTTPSVKCAHCQTEMPVGDRFCQICGKEQPPTATVAPPGANEGTPKVRHVSRVIWMLSAAVLLAGGWIAYRHLLTTSANVAAPVTMQPGAAQGTLTTVPSVPPDDAAGNTARRPFATVYRAVFESERALEITLQDDGRAIFKQESWAAGGYDRRKITVTEGSWRIAADHEIELHHDAVTEKVRFDEHLSFAEFGQKGDAPGIKGTRDVSAGVIGRASLWRAEALDKLFAQAIPTPQPPPPSPSPPSAARIFAEESVFLGGFGGYRNDVGANSVNLQDHLAFASRQSKSQLIQNLVWKYQTQLDIQAAKGIASAREFYAMGSARLAAHGFDLGDAGSNLRDRRPHLAWAEKQTPKKMREALGEKVNALLNGAFASGPKP